MRAVSATFLNLIHMNIKILILILFPFLGYSQSDSVTIYNSCSESTIEISNETADIFGVSDQQLIDEWLYYEISDVKDTEKLVNAWFQYKDMMKKNENYIWVFVQDSHGDLVPLKLHNYHASIHGIESNDIIKDPKMIDFLISESVKL